MGWKVIVMALLVVHGYATKPKSDKVIIEFRNRCPFPVWPAFYSNGSAPSNSGFRLDTAQRKAVEVPFEWMGHVWVRTYCDNSMNCLTGSCGNRMDCAGTQGEGPYTKAEFILGRNGQDYYYVSLIDGYNVNMAIYPTNSFGSTKNTCQLAGSCTQDVEDFCPKALQVVNNDRMIACSSACQAFHDPSYCCKYPFDTPEECATKNWPVDFPAAIKKACGRTMTYQFDNVDSLYTCAVVPEKSTKLPRKFAVRLC